MNGRGPGPHFVLDRPHFVIASLHAGMVRTDLVVAIEAGGGEARNDQTGNPALVRL